MMRVRQNGVIVEESATNLLMNYTAFYTNIPIGESSEVNALDGRIRVTRIDTHHFRVDVLQRIHANGSITIGPLVNQQNSIQHRISGWVRGRRIGTAGSTWGIGRNAHGGPWIGNLGANAEIDWAFFQSNNNLQDVNLNLSIRHNAISDANMFTEAGSWIEFKDMMVEDRANFSTSFVEPGMTRQPERLALPNMHQYFDEVGSLELELTPLSGDNIHANGTVANVAWDLWWHPGGNAPFPGLGIGRNHHTTNQFRFLGHASGMNITHNWSNGELIKYRVEWDREGNTTRFYVNGTLLVSTVAWIMPVATQPFQIGWRQNTQSVSNAVFHNLVIRNRWGRTTFNMATGLREPVGGEN